MNSVSPREDRAQRPARTGSRAARRVPGRVQDPQVLAGHVERRRRRRGRRPGRGRSGMPVDHVPQHPVGRVQQDRRPTSVGQGRGGVDVVVVGVGAARSP